MPFGIEHEFFVLSANGPPTLAEMAAFAREGVNCGASSAERPGALLDVSTCIGNAEVKPDAYTHILEVAFPPADCLCNFAKAFDHVMDVVRRALSRVGLAVQVGAVAVPFTEDSLTLFAATALQRSRLAAILARRLPDGRLAERHAHAVVCSTHVHLDLDHAKIFGVFPRVYRFQYLVPFGFSNSRTKTTHALRPLILRDSFHAPEWLYGYPWCVPQSFQEHRRMLQSTTVGRDYSFVASHRLGTFEFRACDSQPSGDCIAELAALQTCIAAEALGASGAKCSPDGEELFWASCETGAVERSILMADLNALEARAAVLPSSIRRWAFAAISRLADLARRQSA